MHVCTHRFIYMYIHMSTYGHMYMVRANVEVWLVVYWIMIRLLVQE